MRFSRLALLVLSAVAPALTTEYPKSITLTYTLLGSTPSKPQPLAEILYDPATFKSHLSSWTPPSTSNLQSSSVDDQSSPLIRVSLPDGSSSVTTLSAFDPEFSQYIDLWLSAGTDATIFSASISAISPPSVPEEQAKEIARQKRKEERAKAKGKPLPSPKPTPKTSKSKKSKKTEVVDVGPVVKVNLFKQDTGPRPKLISRKPPQIDEEGKEVVQEEAQEKTLFQKYWWVFLAVTFLLIGSGGGDK